MERDEVVKTYLDERYGTDMRREAAAFVIEDFLRWCEGHNIVIASLEIIREMDR